MSHNSFPPLLSETERWCCLRSHCCHKVLISHDIYCPLRALSMARQLRLFLHNSLQIRFCISARDLRLLSLNVKYQVFKLNWLLCSWGTLKVNQGNTSILSTTAPKELVSFVTSFGIQCWWLALTESLHLCQLSFPFPLALQCSSPLPPNKHTLPTHTHTHTPIIASLRNVPDVLATERRRTVCE